MQEKLPCPDCGKECAGEYRLKTHVYGEHLARTGESEREAFLAKYKDSLRGLFESHEPEPTEEDETIDAPAEGKKCYDLSGYFDKADPLCREERQYALFLYEAIERRDPSLLEELGIDGEILFLAFEAAIMRDFWHRDKEGFNLLLKAYTDKEADYQSIIGKAANHANHWEKAHPLARWMMNLKPDLCIVHEKSGEPHLKFIECKYCSREDGYWNKDHNYRMTQTEAQTVVGEFLCAHLKYKGRELIFDTTLLWEFADEKAGGKGWRSIQRLLASKT